VSRTWTNLYVQFSLERADRDRLDAHLSTRGTSLGVEIRHTLSALLANAGIDPAALDGPAAPDSDRTTHLEAT
jgi:hypothetical protein